MQFEMEMDELDQKAQRDISMGKVVRKDLLHRIKKRHQRPDVRP